MITFILALILLSFLFAKPVFERHPLTSFNYLSRERTCCINGVFVWLVFIGHLNSYPIQLIWLEKPINAEITQLAQLIVTTFFLYTGYGIMNSLINKGGNYAKSLLLHRLPHLLLLFASIVLLFWGIETLIGRSYPLSHVLISLTGYQTLENSGWFIFITLLAYIEIALSYMCFSRFGHTTVAIIVAIIMCSLMPMFEASVMNDTVLCIPFGMLLRIYRKEIDHIASKLPFHIGILGILLAISGRYLYLLNGAFMLPASHSTLALFSLYIVDNIGGAMFALGITWIYACFSFKRIPHFLLWSGGVALFYIYILQRIPMMLGVYWGFNSSHPMAYIICCTVATILLAGVFVYTPRFTKKLLSLCSKTAPRKAE